MIDLERKIECIVRLPAAKAGAVTLLEYLSWRFTYHSSEAWRERIARGEILLDGMKVPENTVLHGKEKIAYFPGDLPEPEVNTAYRVVYQDEFILLADKPGNLPSHPAGRYFKHTLWYLLRRDSGREFYPVNRLDSETSGLILWAADTATAGFLGREGRIRHKRYLAVVEGIFPERLSAEGYLFPDRESRIRKKRKFSFSPPEGEVSGGKVEYCRTDFELISSGGGRSLIQAELHTGRTHQIRATLCSLGYPIYGDILYGRDETLFLRRVRDGVKFRQLTDGVEKPAGTDCGPAEKGDVYPGLALKAVHLELFHPGKKEFMTFSLPVPEDYFSLLT